jgi:hypothetical protein
MEWYIAHTGLCTAVIVLLSMLPTGVMLPLMYRRSRESSPEAEGS